MIRARKAGDRGHADYGWLDTWHTFSFGDYYDEKQMGFRHLRVINEDVVAPGGGFPPHGHRDMEILTWVLSGGLAHTDSMGNGSVIRPGEAQVMSAGTGIQHSEMNASRSEPVHLLQIWLLPERRGLPPRYDQKMFPGESRKNRLCLIASRDGADGSLVIVQSVRVYAALLDAGAAVVHEGRPAWLQVARGEVTLNRAFFAAGDGAAAEEEPELRIEATQPSEILLFTFA